MAHVQIALYAPPGVHEEFKRKVNDWRYTVQGAREGDVAPFVSEIKYYDIRIPKDAVGDFLRDMKAHTPDDMMSHFTGEGDRHHDLGKRSVWKIMKFLYRKLWPFNIWKGKKGKPQNTISKSWNIPVVIGCFEDCKMKNELTGEEREVL